jgi:predicted RNA binding protein YcfA (HicA-like mRNA interferase family)
VHSPAFRNGKKGRRGKLAHPKEKFAEGWLQEILKDLHIQGRWWNWRLNPVM